MINNYSKPIIWMMLAVFIISIFPAVALAGPKAEISLEKAINIVKTNFEVPEEYKDFNSGFSEDGNRQLWNLSWEMIPAPGAGGGNFNAQVDAVTGEIINMSNWQWDNQPQDRQTKISPLEARDIAIACFKKVAAPKTAYLQEIPDNRIMNLSSYGPGTYTMSWQRFQNQIPVEGDGLDIEVNLANGKVSHYNLRWNKSAMPNPTGIITLEKAEAAFKNAKMLELEYLLKNRAQPLTADKDQRQIKLVYRLVHKSAGSIDANTGQPYENTQQNRMAYEKSMMPSMGAANDSAQSAIPLTPEEEEEVSQTANLLTQEKAIAALQKWVQPPNGTVLRSANLARDWQDPNSRIWNLQWASTKSDDYSYLFAEVNARTGEIISFGFDYPRTGKKDYSLDSKTARQIAENFLKQIQPQRFAQVAFEPQSEIPPTPADLPSCYLQWTRMVNGVKCPSNGFNVSIDRDTEQVLSFNMSWTDQKFPAPAGVLGINKAEAAFLSKTPLILIYRQIYNQDGTQNYKLLYTPWDPEQRTAINIIDAFTGAALDWQGNPLAKQPQAYTFDDIKGHYAEKEISLIGKAGFMGEYGSSFHPQENINAAGLFRLLIGTRDGLSSVKDYTDNEILMQAANKGWLKETIAKDSVPDRELLCKAVIRSLGLDYLAQVPGIYQYPYKDKVDSTLEGYATLCWGLGIIKGDGQNFAPAKPISRAEAAVVAIRLLNQVNR